MTNKLSKRTQSIREIVEINKTYSFEEAIDLLQNKISKPKFVESIDVSVKLGIDPRKSDQVVRGATLLPKGSGKTVRIAVFTQGQNATAALEAGADKVGMDDLASEFQKGDIQYDVVIASPDAMGIVGRLGPLLGPRGLMPNPKVGTVTMNVAQAVKNAKAGQVRFRADKTGIIHCSIGKIDFQAADLKENLEALMVDLRKAKPSTSKGVYLQKISISSTMGPGLTVEMSSITF